MKKYLRGFGVVFLFAFFGVGALFIRYCIFPFQKTKAENYQTLQKSWQFFIWLISKTGVVNVTVEDLEKIKNIKNSIIVSTHPSFIDIVILMSIIPYSTCFVAPKLAKNPFFRGMVELLFILDTNSIDEWLNNSLEKLNEGLNLIIFPMGIRHDRNEFPKIRRGTSLIALKSKKNIIALDIQSDTKFLQAHQPIYEAGEKTVEYTIKYLTEINTEEFLEKYPDEVTFKTELTKKITKTLYYYKK